jgi:heme-degrading monooxygenase HmoA
MNKTIQLNSENSYLYIWKFQVTPGKEAEFRRLYGPEGEWVQLFRRGIGYRQTLLLKDIDVPGAYTTIDLWESMAAYKAFKKEFSEEFEKLDEQCENLTESEVQVGRFETL